MNYSQKIRRFPKASQKPFLMTEMEGMERVFDVIIGVFEDDRRTIPQTAPTAASTTTSGGK